MFALFDLIFLVVAAFLDNILGTANESYGFEGGVIYGLYTLSITIPFLAVGVRRLHDVGKSGWMLLITFIPLIGTIWFLVLLCTDSQQGSNKWGNNPKEVNFI